MPKINLSHFEAAFLFALFTSVVMGITSRRRPIKSGFVTALTALGVFFLRSSPSAGQWRARSRVEVHFDHRNFQDIFSKGSMVLAPGWRLHLWSGMYCRTREIMQVALAYKNFAANRAISHIGLRVTATEHRQDHA